MMIVVAIIGLMVGITFPAVSAGLDSVRLASATDSLASFLNAAVNRAERRQQPMELIISPKDNLLTLYSNEPGFTRELRLPRGHRDRSRAAAESRRSPRRAPPHSHAGRHGAGHRDSDRQQPRYAPDRTA